jgi:hypothetical protein
MRWIAALLAAAMVAVPAPAQASDRERWDTKVFARVGHPGYPALPHVRGDRVYEGTYTNPRGDSTPSVVREYTADGLQLRSWEIEGQDLAAEHGIQVTAHTADGRLVLNDRTPARTLLLDTATGEQTTYATYADLPTCSPLGGSGDCSPTLADHAPMPNVSAWGPDGGLYTTDFQQGVIWRVSPGGGAAQVWLSDPVLAGETFGTAGIALGPDRDAFLIAQAMTNSAGPGIGGVYRIPLNADGSAGTPEKLWASGPGELPDGLAVTETGRIYVTLVGLAAQVVVLEPTGAEVERFPEVPVTGDNGSPIPFDSPSGATFLGSRLLIANQSFLGDRDHQAILDVETGEPGLNPYVPQER